MKAQRKANGVFVVVANRLLLKGKYESKGFAIVSGSTVTDWRTDKANLWLWV